MKHALAAAALAALFTASAHAERLYAVRPLDGYACARLNATDAQMLNPNGTGITILSAPKADAAPGLLAPAVLFVRQPPVVVNGFQEVMQINGKPGWISTRYVKPMDPTARCTPSVMSNGRLGIG